MSEPDIIPVEPMINPNAYLSDGSSINNMRQVIVNRNENIVIH